MASCKETGGKIFTAKPTPHTVWYLIIPRRNHYNLKYRSLKKYASDRVKPPGKEVDPMHEGVSAGPAGIIFFQGAFAGGRVLTKSSDC